MKTSNIDFYLFPERIFLDRFFEGLNLFPKDNEYPICDIFQNDDGSNTLELAVAGYSIDDLSVSVDRQSIEVSSKKIEDDRKGFRRLSRRAFSRRFSDPRGVFDFTGSSVKLKNGILSIHIPLKKECEPKTLEIVEE